MPSLRRSPDKLRPRSDEGYVIYGRVDYDPYKRTRYNFVAEQGCEIRVNQPIREEALDAFIQLAFATEFFAILFGR